MLKVAAQFTQLYCAICHRQSFCELARLQWLILPLLEDPFFWRAPVLKHTDFRMSESRIQPGEYHFSQHKANFWDQWFLLCYLILCFPLTKISTFVLAFKSCNYHNNNNNNLTGVPNRFTVLYVQTSCIKFIYLYQLHSSIALATTTYSVILTWTITILCITLSVFSLLNTP